MEKEILLVSDKDFGLDYEKLDNPVIRVGARGIIFNNDGKIAVINKRQKNEYKLPGGGVEDGEIPNEAFMREVLEETGCNIRISEYLGTAIEEKNKNNFKQISHVFVGKVVDDTGILHLTEKESDEDTTVIWVDINEALQLIKNCFDNLKGSKYDDLYKTKFMVKRDEKILEYYLDKMN